MKPAFALAMTFALAASSVEAQELPQWILRAGVHPVQPKLRNHEQLHIRGVRGYVGAGLNYTAFFDERTSGVLQGGELRLAKSWGPAANAGLDFDLGRRWFDIDTAARLNGTSLGTLEMDPYAVGMTIGRRLQ